jgi:hypothetical protein
METYNLIPSSTISPTKTLAIPAIAMTAFCDTEFPVIVCINWKIGKLKLTFGGWIQKNGV